MKPDDYVKNPPTKDEVLAAIPAPIAPVGPELIDVSSIPDRQCDWGGEWDSDYHDGYVCSVCDEYSDCTHCNRGWKVALDCARNVAKERNRVRKKEYSQLLAKYEAQMEYYREITN